MKIKNPPNVGIAIFPSLSKFEMKTEEYGGVSERLRG